MPQQFRFDNTAQAESIADLPWWQFFDDPYLQALIREAIAGNLDLRAAIARVEQARAQAGIARSFLYPRADGVAEYETFQHTGSDLDGVQHGLEARRFLLGPGHALDRRLDLLCRCMHQRAPIAEACPQRLEGTAPG